MGHENEEIMKGDMDVASLGTGRLDPKRAREFIQLIFNQSRLNQSVRKVVMTQSLQKIDRLHLNEPVSELATENTSSGDLQSPEYSQIQMSAKKLRSNFNLTHEFLRENIEGENFEDKFMNAVAGKMAEDIERLTIMGDTSISGSSKTDKLLKTLDGWHKLALNRSHIVDVAGGEVSKDLFSFMKRSMPTQYQANPALRWMISPNIMTDYTNVVSDRATMAGDRALEDGTVKILGIPAMEVPLIPDDLDVVAGASTPAQLVSSALEMYTIKAGVNDKITLNIDASGAQAKTIPEGVYFAAELGIILAGLFTGVKFAALNQKLLMTSLTGGASSSIEVIAVAGDAYAEIGLSVGTVTGAATSGTLKEGSFIWLGDPRNFAWGILGDVRMLVDYNNDFDRREIRFFSEHAAEIENADALVMATNVRRKALI